MSRQRPNAEDLADYYPTAGYVPVSQGFGFKAAWEPASGGGGGGGGVITKLAEVGPLGGAQATIRLPASGSISGGPYTKYTLSGRAKSASGTRSLFLNFNGDAGANYNYLFVRNDGFGFYGPESTSGDVKIPISSVVEPTANFFTSFEVTIERPNDTDGYKVVDFKTSAPASSGVMQVNDGSGLWLATASIVDIELALSGGFNLAAGSYAVLYGWS